MVLSLGLESHSSACLRVLYVVECELVIMGVIQHRHLHYHKCECMHVAWYIYSGGKWRKLRSVFLNRRAAAWYWALASIIMGRERFSWRLVSWLRGYHPVAP